MDTLVSGDNVVIALLATYLIQWMKDHKAKAFQWLSSDRPEIVRGFSACVAALAAAGITMEFHAGTLTISGLELNNLVNFLLTGLSQFVMQHFAFKVGISVPNKLKSPDS